MLLKDRKTGDVYELNIVNVVVECDIIYVSILYHLYRICKAEQFAGIYSPLVKSIYILKVQRRGGGDENFKKTSMMQIADIIILYIVLK